MNNTKVFGKSNPKKETITNFKKGKCDKCTRIMSKQWYKLEDKKVCYRCAKDNFKCEDCEKEFPNYFINGLSSKSKYSNSDGFTCAKCLSGSCIENKERESLQIKYMNKEIDFKEISGFLKID